MSRGSRRRRAAERGHRVAPRALALRILGLDRFAEAVVDPRRMTRAGLSLIALPRGARPGAIARPR